MMNNKNSILEKNKYNYNFLKKNLSTLLIFVVFILTVIFFSIKSKDYLTIKNIITNIIAISTIGTVCIGQTMLLISGTFDISVGAVVGFSGVILAKLLDVFGVQSLGASLFVFLITIFLGAFIGFVNGIIITKIKINALITTIAMLSIIFGISLVITKSKYISVNAHFFRTLGAFPNPMIILIILYIIFYVILKTTVFGRYIYAIGNNEIAAKYAGINTDLIRIILFTLTSALAAIAGVLLSSKLTSAQAIFGQNYPLVTVAAVVIGGTPLSGGKGGVLGSLLGISFFIFLENGLILIKMPTYIQDLITGIILIIALFISEIWTKKR